MLGLLRGEKPCSSLGTKQRPGENEPGVLECRSARRHSFAERALRSSAFGVGEPSFRSAFGLARCCDTWELEPLRRKKQ